MKRVILESPYAGDVERNVAYARACLRDSLLRGEAPIASHLLYTQPGVLDDQIPEERQMGIDAGLAWGMMDPQVHIKVHAQPGGQRVATVTTSAGRVLRVCGATGRGGERLPDVVEIMKSWVTWERRGRP